MESQLLKQNLREVALDPDRHPDPFEDLDHILDVAEEEDLLPMLVTETEPALKEGRVDKPRYYVHGFAQFRLGNPDGAWKAVLPLAGKLEHEEHWRALGLLCGRALEYAPRVEAALAVAKAFESAGFEDLDPALLQRAYEGFPDESRLAYLMGEGKAREAAAAEGGAESPEGCRLLDEARSYWAEALDGFIALKRGPQIEEAILRIADSEDPEILKHLIAALKKMGEQNQWGRMEGSLELALPALRKAGLIHDLWALILKLLPSAPAGIDLRKHLRDLAHEAFPEVEGIMDILNRSGVLETENKVEAALKTLEPLLAFAPGYYILHASWGVGKVRLNDGETLILDFQETNNHRMAVSLARRALQVVPPDDLRVLKVTDPAGLKAKVKQAPGDVAFLAIRQLGGQATTQELKRTLVATEILTAGQWASWWKEAKAAMEGDTRFDLSQAFRQTYRVRSATEDGGLALPALEPRRGIRPNLNLIRRFLEQHPGEAGRAALTYANILARWGRQERTNAEDRMAIHLQLYRWTKKVDEEFVEALAGMLDASIEASVYSDRDDQELIIRTGLAQEKLWKQTAYFALSSRYPELRDLALERLRQDPETAQSLLRVLLHEPAGRPVAALQAMALSVPRGKPEPFAPDVWDAAIGAATLIESTSRDPLRKQAMSLLGPNASLVEHLLKTEPTDLQLDRVGMLVRRWRSSERFLQPLLQILRRTGREGLVREARSERMARTNQLLATQEEEHLDLPGQMMTRLTFERLKREAERLNYELKTTVAQAIAKARELGDLSENAEYDAARMKQADFTERLQSIAGRLQEAKIIDELPDPGGRVAPGTEVEVEDKVAGTTRRLWILGEGDDVLGPEVVSYAAPLGRALLGKRAGESVSIPGDEVTHEFEIRSVRRRLPEPPSGGYGASGGTPAGPQG